MKYDLKAMEFDPDGADVFGMFDWTKTPEGPRYWVIHYQRPHQEGRDKIAAMLKQWKEEQDMTEPTRPAINILHKHDGSDESPIPNGTLHTHWDNEGYSCQETDTMGCNWSTVSEYLVHSYPPEKRKPREFWVNVHPDGQRCHLTEKFALSSGVITNSEIIHVREVLE